jgi:hypothetical protein
LDPTMVDMKVEKTVDVMAVASVVLTVELMVV